MTEFKIGDRVTIATDARYTSGGNSHPLPERFRGTSGVVKFGPDRDGDLAVQSDTGGYEAVSPQYLTHETYTFDPGGEKIAYGDVQVGDTIAAFQYGFWRVGEAETLRNRYVTTSSGATLVNSDADDIRLLHRPEPEVDREQVEALARVLENIPYAPLKEIGVPYGDVDFVPVATELVKAGVKVDA